jgi:hypothetical protein
MCENIKVRRVPSELFIAISAAQFTVRYEYAKTVLILKNSTWCPHCVYVFCTDLRKKTATFAL